MTTDTRKCTACQVDKPESAFRRARSRPDRLSVRCGDCIDAGIRPGSTGEKCTTCKERVRRAGGPECNTCHDGKYREARLDARKRRWEQRRLRLLGAYGGQCVVCGESDTDVLLLDHVNDDGAQHRSSVGNDQVYRDLERQGYPPTVQVLCANDDMRKRRGRFGSTGA